MLRWGWFLEALAKSYQNQVSPKSKLHLQLEWPILLHSDASCSIAVSLEFLPRQFLPYLYETCFLSLLGIKHAASHHLSSPQSPFWDHFLSNKVEGNPPLAKSFWLILRVVLVFARGRRAEFLVSLFNDETEGPTPLFMVCRSFVHHHHECFVFWWLVPSLK